MPSQPTNAGIVTDDTSGERHIPESTRPDGSTRKAIKIRPGYRPPEDVEVYRNRTAEAFRERGKRIGVVPGATEVDETEKKQHASSSSSPAQTTATNKNAKRREARKRATKAAADEGGAKVDAGKAAGGAPDNDKEKEEEEVDPEAEKLKKVRNLKKKLKQAKELKSKKEEGEALLPEQIAKVIKINELIRELDALGFDAEGELKTTENTG
jgi:partner of Y14 and mago protein